MFLEGENELKPRRSKEKCLKDVPEIGKQGLSKNQVQRKAW